MKKYFFYLAGCALFCICLANSTDNETRETAVTITDTNESYKLMATYPEGKIKQVQRFINKSIAPNSLFASGDDFLDVVTALSDHTKFRIKSFHGDLSISLDKNENSKASFERIKKMCEGLKAIIEK